MISWIIEWKFKCLKIIIVQVELVFESNKIRIWHSQIRLSYLEHPRRFSRLKSNHYFHFLDFHALHLVVSSISWYYSAHFSLFENYQELLNCWQYCYYFWEFQKYKQIWWKLVINYHFQISYNEPNHFTIWRTRLNVEHENQETEISG